MHKVNYEKRALTEMLVALKHCRYMQSVCTEAFTKHSLSTEQAQRLCSQFIRLTKTPPDFWSKVYCSKSMIA